MTDTALAAAVQHACLLHSIAAALIDARAAGVCVDGPAALAAHARWAIAPSRDAFDAGLELARLHPAFRRD